MCAFKAYTYMIHTYKYSKCKGIKSCCFWCHKQVTEIKRCDEQTDSIEK